MKGHKAAAREAKEEAGVRGKIKQKPFGRFRYFRTEKKAEGPISVTVFLLLVRMQLKRWREKDQRRREWFPVESAATEVQEPKLS